MTARGFSHVYVHVPFCRTKCPYCDFASIACGESGDGDAEVAALKDAYVPAVLEQAANDSLVGQCRDIDTLYIGGGTPTALGHGLVGLVRSLAEILGVEAGAEVTVEANPDSASTGLLEALVDAGVTRVSVGVQSFDDAVLDVLGRPHGSVEAASCVESVVRCGVDVSVDLMCGVPGQSMSSWLDSLDRAVGSGAAHVSVYPLQLEDATPLAGRVERGDLPAPDAETTADMMIAAQETLARHGLVRYEVANYAARGKESRHNVAYWTGRQYLGLGASAHGMCDAATALEAGLRGIEPAATARVRFATTNDVATYVRDPAGSMESVESLGEREARIEAIRDTSLQEVFSGMESDGLVESAGESWRTTDRGWLLGNEVFGRIWGAR